MNPFRHLYLCLLILSSSLQLQANEQTAYWQGTNTDGVEVLWMTRHNADVGTAHAISSNPSVIHSQFAYDSQSDTWDATFIEDTWLPMSSWWRANNKLEAAPTETGLFRFSSAPQASLEVQLGSNRTQFQAVANLQTESKSYPFKIYQCQQTVRKLQFKDPALRPLETELAALTQSEIEKAQAYWNMQYERDGEILITPRREIDIEQRLLHLKADRCTLLLISQTYSGGAKGSTNLLALNYFLTSAGQWQRYIPLTRHAEPDTLKAGSS